MGANPEQDPKAYCFGFGRRFLSGSFHHDLFIDREPCRVCPGTHLADSSIWISIAKSVAAFSVTKAVGADGQVIVPVAETTDGVIAYVLHLSHFLLGHSEHFPLGARSHSFVISNHDIRQYLTWSTRRWRSDEFQRRPAISEGY
jgi:hypothetical protein